MEKERIETQIGKYIVGIHHIGSTAVKHLSAKPIIDIGIELRSFSDGELCVSPLKELGYSYKGTNILPERHYFNKGEPRTHQIHMYQQGSQFLQEQWNHPQADFIIDDLREIPSILGNLNKINNR